MASKEIIWNLMMYYARAEDQLMYDRKDDFERYINGVELGENSRSNNVALNKDSW